MSIGIYKIINLHNGKVYIGQSINLTHRLTEHRLKLSKGIHSNKYLQNAWNKYGEQNFKFEIIEICLETELTERENFWINYYGGYESKQNYNHKSAEAHVKYSKESRVKMSESQRGLQSGKKNGMYGKHHTAETKKKLSDLNKVKFSGKNNPMFGKHHNEQTKEYLRQLKKGKKLSEKHKQSISEAEKNIWIIRRKDPLFKEKMKKRAENHIKYTEDKKQEIYNVYKELKSRKATSKKLNIPWESCRLIINEMIERENKEVK